MDEIAKLCADLAAARVHRADDLALKSRSGARTPPAVARKGLEKPLAGILVQDEAPRGWMTGEKGCNAP